VIRYDPLRIMAAEEVEWLPATQRPIVAHCRQHPAGQVWEGAMRFSPGGRLIADFDPTGGGTALEVEFPLEPGTDEVECWFSYVDGSGDTRWDSEMGANYWLRFPTHDLEYRTAAIEARPKEALDLFHLEVESIEAVESATVRWRSTTALNDARYEHPLAAGASAGGRKLWTLPADRAGVVSDSPIAFDVVYTVGGHKFTDDNDGSWHVISRAGAG
jgi:hypothetical protein